MEDSNDISAACRQAADALEILSNLRPGFARNVVPRLNSSPTVGQTNSEGRAAVESTLSSASVSSPPVSSTAQIATRLATCFPTLGANRSNNRAKRSARPKLSAKAKSVRGRPAKAFVYRDLVLLPSPRISKVPTHESRVKLEERQLVCHEFPFDKSWDADALKSAILKQFPRLLLFEYVKPCYGKLVTPNLADGITLDAERVTKMAGQGAVYVRASIPLESEDEDEDDSELFDSVLELRPEPIPLVIPQDDASPLAIPQHDTSPVVIPQQDAIPIMIAQHRASPVAIPQQDELNTEVENVQTGVDQICSDMPSDLPKRIIKVHRLNVKRDMIDTFRDPLIMKYELEVIAIDCRGIDELGKGIGVLRDILSLFWKEVYKSLFIGENERIPFVRHDYQRDEWEAVARILVKGYLSCQYLPLLLSPTFLAYLFWGESVITSPMLLKSLGNYISVDEKNLMDKCIAGDMNYDGDEMPDLLEMLSNYDCRCQVNSGNIIKVFEEIAHKELIQKPQYIADCWKDIISSHLPTFPDLKSLNEKYESLTPSTSKLLSCIEANPVNDAERESLKFLKKFIKGLDSPQKLNKFVRFISGSELMLFHALQVHFTNLSGLGRRPVAHTCNTVLELSSTYQSFSELREEFSHILLSDYWEIDMV